MYSIAMKMRQRQPRWLPRNGSISFGSGSDQRTQEILGLSMLAAIPCTDGDQEGIWNGDDGQYKYNGRMQGCCHPLALVSLNQQAAVQ